MVQIHAGRLAAGEKSLRKAPPCMHCCQPCRQSGSRRVLSTVANLIWVFSKVTADALWTCLGRLEIQRQLRRAVHGKVTPPNRNAPSKILSKWKKRRRGVLEKMTHQTLSKKPAITPYIPMETCIKNGPTR